MPGPDRDDEVPTLSIVLESTDPEASFVLSAGGEPLCTSPCEHRVRADDLVTVTELREGVPVEMTIENLRRYAAAGAIRVTAEPRSEGQLVGGMALLALGGVGVLAGAVTMLLGGHGDLDPVTRERETNTDALIAGGIVLGVGAVALPIGMVVFWGHQEEIEVKPIPGAKAPHESAPSTSLTIGPGLLRATF